MHQQIPPDAVRIWSVKDSVGGPNAGPFLGSSVIAFAWRLAIVHRSEDDLISLETRSGSRGLSSGALSMMSLMLLNIFSGLLLVALSVPLILGKIGPNPWYGFRVKKTLNDPAVWYPANAYAGKRLLVVGLVGSLFAVLFFFVPKIDLNTYATGCAFVTIGGLLVAVIQCFLYLRTRPANS